MQTWSGLANQGAKLRISQAPFVIGQDRIDGQKFEGKIAEVKVWNRFVLGDGIPSRMDPQFVPTIYQDQR